MNVRRPVRAATVGHLRHAMERADHEDRRPIVRLAVGAAVIAADRVHLELTADTAAGQRGVLGNPNASPVRHGIPVEVPIVPPRPQTYRPRRTA